MTFIFAKFVIFQSTRPLRGETLPDRVRHHAYQVFNPLAPCGARHAGSNMAYAVYVFSIHSPLAGRDQTGWYHKCKVSGFQSTRPLRGETEARMAFVLTAINFSIHSPLAGRDHQQQGNHQRHGIFNPLAPCGARHTTKKKLGRNFDFSIHSPLAGRDTGSAPSGGRKAVFNPLAPCGARPSGVSSLPSSKIFQSTRPLRGETRRRSRRRSSCRLFNPLAPCGARPSHLRQPSCRLAFSIHSPLAGRDKALSSESAVSSIFNPLAPCGARQQTITKIVCKRYSCCTVHFPTNPPRGASGRKTGCASRKTGIHLVRTYREFGVYCRFASQDQRFIHRKDG